MQGNYILFLPNENPLENMAANISFLFEPELKEHFNMTISKVHIISALIMRVLFVQESIEDCLQEDSDYFADVFPSAALLFLKND